MKYLVLTGDLELFVTSKPCGSQDLQIERIDKVDQQIRHHLVSMTRRPPWTMHPETPFRRICSGHTSECSVSILSTVLYYGTMSAVAWKEGVSSWYVRLYGHREPSREMRCN